MVRETRHLWVGNLPETVREDRIREHFKRTNQVRVTPNPWYDNTVQVQPQSQQVQQPQQQPQQQQQQQQQQPLPQSIPRNIYGNIASAAVVTPDSGYDIGSERRNSDTIDILTKQNKITTKLKNNSKIRSGSESPCDGESDTSHSHSRSPSSCSSTNSTSSNSNESGSPGSGTDPPHKRNLQSAVSAPTPNQSNPNPVVHSDDNRPLAICVRNLPARSSDTSLKDGLFHEYKKHGKVTWVKVVGQSTDRYALVCFKKPDDVEKALEVSHDKLFFGCKIDVEPYQGYDVDDNEFRPYEAELDEYHPKSTRTLFIGNLEKDITANDLRKHFECFGEIIEIDIKKQGVTAYAFCQYSDIISVVKAMRKMDGEHLGNNRIKLGFGKSMPTNCVWIDGISDSVSESYLTTQFNRFGPVSQVAIDRDRKLALVFFEQIQYAQTAVKEMRGITLRGRKLQVDFASRECQEAFYEKLEKPGSDRERPPVVFESAREVSTRGFETTVSVPGARYSRYDTPGRSRTSSFSRHGSVVTNSGAVSPSNISGGTTPRGSTRSSRIIRYPSDYYDGEFPERNRFKSYDEYSQGSGASHEDIPSSSSYSEHENFPIASYPRDRCETSPSPLPLPLPLQQQQQQIRSTASLLLNEVILDNVCVGSVSSGNGNGSNNNVINSNSNNNNNSASSVNSTIIGGNCSGNISVCGNNNNNNTTGLIRRRNEKSPGICVQNISLIQNSGDIRHLQKERVHLLEQLEECPSSGDELLFSPKKRVKYNNDNIIINQQLNNNNNNNNNNSSDTITLLSGLQNNNIIINNNIIDSSNCDSNIIDSSLINHSSQQQQQQYHQHRKCVEIRRLSESGLQQKLNSNNTIIPPTTPTTPSILIPPPIIPTTSTISSTSTLIGIGGTTATPLSTIIPINSRRPSIDLLTTISTTATTISSSSLLSTISPLATLTTTATTTTTTIPSCLSSTSTSSRHNSEHSSNIMSHYTPHSVCKRRKTGNSDLESHHTSRGRGHQLHSHHSHEASGGESADGSRPGTPLCDERPENIIPTEPRRLPSIRDRSHNAEPLSLPLPRFAAHIFNQNRSFHQTSLSSLMTLPSPLNPVTQNILNSSILLSSSSSINNNSSSSSTITSTITTSSSLTTSLSQLTTTTPTTTNCHQLNTSLLSSPPPITTPIGLQSITLTQLQQFTSSSPKININQIIPPSPSIEQPPASPSRAPSLSSNSSDSEMATSSPSLEERIKTLDEMFEKWNGGNTGRNHIGSVSSSSGQENCNLRTIGSSAGSSLYTSRHKFLDLDVNEVQPSEIVKSVLAKKSIFDDDLKRLENIGDKYEPRDFLNINRSSNVTSTFISTTTSTISSSSKPSSLTGLSTITATTASSIVTTPVPIMTATTIITPLPIKQNVVQQLFQSPSNINQIHTRLSSVGSPLNSPQPISPYSSPSLSPSILATSGVGIINYKTNPVAATLTSIKGLQYPFPSHPPMMTSTNALSPITPVIQNPLSSSLLSASATSSSSSSSSSSAASSSTTTAAASSSSSSLSSVASTTLQPATLKMLTSNTDVSSSSSSSSMSTPISSSLKQKTNTITKSVSLTEKTLSSNIRLLNKSVSIPGSTNTGTIKSIINSSKDDIDEDNNNNINNNKNNNNNSNVNRGSSRRGSADLTSSNKISNKNLTTKKETTKHNSNNNNNNNSNNSTNNNNNNHNDNKLESERKFNKSDKQRECLDRRKSEIDDETTTDTTTKISSNISLNETNDTITTEKDNEKETKETTERNSNVPDVDQEIERHKEKGDREKRDKERKRERDEKDRREKEERDRRDEEEKKEKDERDRREREEREENEKREREKRERLEQEEKEKQKEREKCENERRDREEKERHDKDERERREREENDRREREIENEKEKKEQQQRDEKDKRDIDRDRSRHHDNKDNKRREQQQQEVQQQINRHDKDLEQQNIHDGFLHSNKNRENRDIIIIDNRCKEQTSFDIKHNNPDHSQTLIVNKERSSNHLIDKDNIPKRRERNNSSGSSSTTTTITTITSSTGIIGNKRRISSQDNNQLEQDELKRIRLNNDHRKVMDRRGGSSGSSNNDLRDSNRISTEQQQPPSSQQQRTKHHKSHKSSSLNKLNLEDKLKSDKQILHYSTKENDGGRQIINDVITYDEHRIRKDLLIDNNDNNKKKDKSSERDSEKYIKVKNDKHNKLRNKSKELKSSSSPDICLYNKEQSHRDSTEKIFLENLELRSSEEEEKQRQTRKELKEQKKKHQLQQIEHYQQQQQQHQHNQQQLQHDNTSGLENIVKQQQLHSEHKRSDSERRRNEKLQSDRKSSSRRCGGGGGSGGGIDDDNNRTSSKSSSECSRRIKTRKLTSSNSTDDTDTDDEPKKHSIFDIPDEGPAYISMYDKVKARSCKNMQKQEEEKKIKAKFNQLKQSRAKREEKKRSTSWDDDTDSDLEHERRIRRHNHKSGKSLINSSSDDDMKTVRRMDFNTSDSELDIRRSQYNRDRINELCDGESSDNSMIHQQKPRHKISSRKNSRSTRIESDTTDDDDNNRTTTATTTHSNLIKNEMIDNKSLVKKIDILNDNNLNIKMEDDETLADTKRRTFKFEKLKQLSSDDDIKLNVLSTNEIKLETKDSIETFKTTIITPTTHLHDHRDQPLDNISSDGGDCSNIIQDMKDPFDQLFSPETRKKHKKKQKRQKCILPTLTTTSSSSSTVISVEIKSEKIDDIKIEQTSPTLSDFNDIKKEIISERKKHNSSSSSSSRREKRRDKFKDEYDQQHLQRSTKEDRNKMKKLKKTKMLTDSSTSSFSFDHTEIGGGGNSSSYTSISRGEKMEDIFGPLSDEDSDHSVPEPQQTIKLKTTSDIVKVITQPPLPPCETSTTPMIDEIIKLENPPLPPPTQAPPLPIDSDNEFKAPPPNTPSTVTVPLPSVLPVVTISVTQSLTTVTTPTTSGSVNIHTTTSATPSSFTSSTPLSSLTTVMSTIEAVTTTTTTVTATVQSPLTATTTETIVVLEKERHKEESRKRKEKKRKEREKARAAILNNDDENSVDLDEAGRALEAQLMEDCDNKIDDLIPTSITTPKHDSKLNDLGDVFRFTGDNDDTLDTNEKHDNTDMHRTSKDKKKKKKRSREEKHQRREHHHHHSHNINVQTINTTNKKENLPLITLPDITEIQSPTLTKPSPSLPCLIDDSPPHCPSSNTINLPLPNLSLREQQQTPTIISPIPKTPTIITPTTSISTKIIDNNSKRKTDKFISSFGVGIGSIDDNLHETAVKSISILTTVKKLETSTKTETEIDDPTKLIKIDDKIDEKSRVIISQEETEDAVAALLGESFGTSNTEDYTGCYNVETENVGSSPPNPIEAVIPEEDAEEMRKALESLNAEELDIKPETPQSEHDLQIDTDTEDQDDDNLMQMRFDNPPKTPDIDLTQIQRARDIANAKEELKQKTSSTTTSTVVCDAKSVKLLKSNVQIPITIANIAPSVITKSISPTTTTSAEVVPKLTTIPVSKTLTNVKIAIPKIQTSDTIKQSASINLTSTSIIPTATLTTTIPTSLTNTVVTTPITNVPVPIVPVQTTIHSPRPTNIITTGQQRPQLIYTGTPRMSHGIQGSYTMGQQQTQQAPLIKQIHSPRMPGPYVMQAPTISIPEQHLIYQQPLGVMVSPRGNDQRMHSPRIQTSLQQQQQQFVGTEMTKRTSSPQSPNVIRCQNPTLQRQSPQLSPVVSSHSVVVQQKQLLSPSGHNQQQLQHQTLLTTTNPGIITSSATSCNTNPNILHNRMPVTPVLAPISKPIQSTNIILPQSNLAVTNAVKSSNVNVVTPQTHKVQSPLIDKHQPMKLNQHQQQQQQQLPQHIPNSMVQQPTVVTYSTVRVVPSSPAITTTCSLPIQTTSKIINQNQMSVNQMQQLKQQQQQATTIPSHSAKIIVDNKLNKTVIEQMPTNYNQPTVDGRTIQCPTIISVPVQQQQQQQMQHQMQQRQQQQHQMQLQQQHQLQSQQIQQQHQQMQQHHHLQQHHMQQQKLVQQQMIQQQHSMPQKQMQQYQQMQQQMHNQQQQQQILHQQHQMQHQKLLPQQNQLLMHQQQQHVLKSGVQSQVSFPHQPVPPQIMQHSPQQMVLTQKQLQQSHIMQQQQQQQHVVHQMQHTHTQQHIINNQKQQQLHQQQVATVGSANALSTVLKDSQEPSSQVRGTSSIVICQNPQRINYSEPTKVPTQNIQQTDTSSTSAVITPTQKLEKDSERKELEISKDDKKIERKEETKLPISVSVQENKDENVSVIITDKTSLKPATATKDDIPKSMLTEENLTKLTNSQEDHLEQDSKEDSDYWSAKEVNIESVIKKVDALCSGEDTSEEGSETKELWTEESKVKPLVNDIIKEKQVDVILETVIPNKIDENAHVDEDDFDEGVGENLDNKDLTDKTIMKRGRITRGKKSTQLTIETPKSNNKLLQHQNQLLLAGQELSVNTAVTTLPPQTIVTTITTTTASTAISTSLLSGVQTRRGGGKTSTIRRGRGGRTSTRTSTTTAMTATQPLLSSSERKTRNTNSESDVYEFNEDSGEEVRPRLILTIKSPALTSNIAASLQQTVIPPQQQQQQQLQQQQLQQQPIITTTPPITTPIVAPIQITQPVKVLTPTLPSQIQVPSPQQDSSKEDFSAPAPNTRKSRRLQERDGTRNTIDDVIEDVVRNVANSPKTLTANSPSSLTTTPTTTTTALSSAAGQTPPRRSTRQTNLTKQLPLPDKSAGANIIDVRKSPRANRKIKDRKTSETSTDSSDEKSRTEEKIITDILDNVNKIPDEKITMSINQELQIKEIVTPEQPTTIIASSVTVSPTIEETEIIPKTTSFTITEHLPVPIITTATAVTTTISTLVPGSKIIAEPSEPLTLIDPVTGELMVMRQSKEGQYIPVPGVPAPKILTPFLTTNVGSAKKQSPVLAVDLPTTTQQPIQSSVQSVDCITKPAMSSTVVVPKTLPTSVTTTIVVTAPTVTTIPVTTTVVPSTPVIVTSKPSVLSTPQTQHNTSQPRTLPQSPSTPTKPMTLKSHVLNSQSATPTKIVQQPLSKGAVKMSTSIGGSSTQIPTPTTLIVTSQSNIVVPNHQHQMLPQQQSQLSQQQQLQLPLPQQLQHSKMSQQHLVQQQLVQQQIQHQQQSSNIVSNMKQQQQIQNSHPHGLIVNNPPILSTSSLLSPRPQQQVSPSVQIQQHQQQQLHKMQTLAPQPQQQHISLPLTQPPPTQQSQLLLHSNKIQSHMVQQQQQQQQQQNMTTVYQGGKMIHQTQPMVVPAALAQQQKHIAQQQQVLQQHQQQQTIQVAGRVLPEHIDMKPSSNVSVVTTHQMINKSQPQQQPQPVPVHMIGQQQSLHIHSNTGGKIPLQPLHLSQQPLSVTPPTLQHGGTPQHIISSPSPAPAHQTSQPQQPTGTSVLQVKPAHQQTIVVGQPPQNKSILGRHQPSQILTGSVASPPLKQPHITNQHQPIAGTANSRASIPPISPQEQSRVHALQGGLPVQAYEGDVNFSSLRGVVPRELMLYQYMRVQQEAIGHNARIPYIRSPMLPGTVDQKSDLSEMEETLGASPPLELRRPSSGPRTTVPHSLQSPQDRATDSPQVAQVYLHGARIPNPHYPDTCARYYETVPTRSLLPEPPPAHHTKMQKYPPLPQQQQQQQQQQPSSQQTQQQTSQQIQQPQLITSSSLSGSVSSSLATPTNLVAQMHHASVIEREREQREREQRERTARERDRTLIPGHANMPAHGNLVPTMPAPSTGRSLQVTTPPHASQVPPQADSLLMLLTRYPVMWQGLLALKNDQAAVQMHFVFGNPQVATDSLPCNSDGSTPPLRIAQRMRLEQSQLDGVSKKMQTDNEHCMLLALPCGRDHMDVLQQSKNLQNGFITYLQQKQAAGIVNIAAPGSQQAAYVVHIFPSCEFANENLARIAPDLLHRVAEIAHLLIIIATV